MSAADNHPDLLTLAAASEGVRKRSISPVELTKTCLERIERLNPSLNAFITVTAEAALERARQMEAEAQHGKWRGPLHGIPIALKDNIDTAGVRTTAASELFKDRVPAEDAEVVRRLKDAGAILLGKTNLHEFAYGGSAAVSYFGAVHNPWAPDRIAGGSSGGSAAATATGMCFAALGTDTAGSIRIPACYCGIVGLKATYGRVSNRGVIPLSWTLDHTGPLCRTVEDAAIVLGAIAGHDEGDASSADKPAADYRGALRSRAPRLRLGILRKPFFDGLDPEVAASIEAAIGALRKMAASVEEVALPPASAPLEEIYGRVRGVEAYAYHAQWVAASPEKYQASTRERIVQNAAGVSAVQYAQARREVDGLRAGIRKLFDKVDLLITPTLPGPPVLISQASDPNAVSLRHTSPFNVLGLPAISIPCGKTSAGLPIGLHIAGAPFAESTVLALAHAFESLTA
jgi:aspartyl-tRNA(Asn)/glutamyl-tRNA(Gln) amidotransferase subunit A